MDGVQVQLELPCIDVMEMIWTHSAYSAEIDGIYHQPESALSQGDQIHFRVLQTVQIIVKAYYYMKPS